MEFIWGGMAIMTLGYGLFIDFSEELTTIKIVLFEIIAGMLKLLLMILDLILGAFNSPGPFSWRRSIVNNFQVLGWEWDCKPH